MTMFRITLAERWESQAGRRPRGTITPIGLRHPSYPGHLPQRPHDFIHRIVPAVGGVAGGATGNYLDKQAQELQQVVNVRRTETGILVNLKSSLLFSSTSAVLQPAAVEQIAQLSDILVRYPEDRIVIQGHTDSTGSAAHDEELSLRRAEAVRDVLRWRPCGAR